MKTFANSNARDFQQAVALVQQTRQEGRAASLVGGGSDLLALVKERIVNPDVLVNLKTIKGLDQVRPANGGVNIGGLITLDTLSRNDVIRRQFTVLAEAAETVATPQIRNVGTLAGNVCQRPWCWYFRNGFPCYKNGGSTCFSFGGENQFHAIFGGGPSYIVHPSDTAVALLALDAKFRIVGPSVERVLPAAENRVELVFTGNRKAGPSSVLKARKSIAEVPAPRTLADVARQRPDVPDLGRGHASRRLG